MLIMMIGYSHAWYVNAKYRSTYSRRLFPRSRREHLVESCLRDLNIPGKLFQPLFSFLLLIEML